MVAPWGSATAANYVVAISTAQAGGAPSGTIAYLLAKSVEGGIDFLSSTKHVASNNHFTISDGANKPVILIKEAYISLKAGDVSKVVTFNDLTEFFISLQDIGKSACYLWIKFQAETDNLQLGYETTTSTDYMTGFIKRMRWVLEGIQLKITELNFERSD